MKLDRNFKWKIKIYFVRKWLSVGRFQKIRSLVVVLVKNLPIIRGRMTLISLGYKYYCNGQRVLLSRGPLSIVIVTKALYRLVLFGKHTKDWIYILCTLNSIVTLLVQLRDEYNVELSSEELHYRNIRFKSLKFSFSGSTLLCNMK